MNLILHFIFTSRTKALVFWYFFIPPYLPTSIIRTWFDSLNFVKLRRRFALRIKDRYFSKPMLFLIRLYFLSLLSTLEILETWVWKQICKCLLNLTCYNIIIQNVCWTLLATILLYKMFAEPYLLQYYYTKCLLKLAMFAEPYLLQYYYTKCLLNLTCYNIIIQNVCWTLLATILLYKMFAEPYLLQYYYTKCLLNLTCYNIIIQNVCWTLLQYYYTKCLQTCYVCWTLLATILLYKMFAEPYLLQYYYTKRSAKPCLLQYYYTKCLLNLTCYNIIIQNVCWTLLATILLYKMFAEPYLLQYYYTKCLLNLTCYNIIIQNVCWTLLATILLYKMFAEPYLLQYYYTKCLLNLTCYNIL